MKRPKVPISWAVGLIVIALVTMLGYLELAQGVQLLLMYTLVLVTAQYAISTHKMAETIEQQRIEAARPSLSLRPEHYTMGGGFGTLLLQNTGGLARDVKIDIETTNPSEKKSLFIPAIDKEHIVYLPTNVHKVSQANGTVKVKLSLRDGFNHSLTEELFIDFGKLKEEGRDFAFQESPIHRVLENIERELRK